MLQVGGDFDFAQEPLDAEDGAEFGLQDLERHAPVVLEIVREVHRRHSARAELALDRIAARQCRLELLAEIHLYSWARVEGPTASVQK